MNLKSFICLLLLAAMVSCKKAPTASRVPEGADSTYTQPDGRRLRAIVAQKFPDSSFIIGATCGLWAFDYEAAARIISEEFNYVTPENDFKQLTIHPDNKTWNSASAEKWIEKANSASQIIRMHCPIGPQVSAWTKADERTADELRENLTSYITAACTTFRKYPSVAYMDVVNETVIDGSWFGALAGNASWENPWTKLGYDSDVHATPLYIKMAFELADKNAPAIKLLYNHHEGPENNESWRLIKETVLYLRAAGLRVDAIGWQAHVANGWATPANVEALRQLIDWAQSNSLEFHITEASSFIVNKPTQAELDLQAETYTKILAVLLEKSKTGKIGWNTWHLTDAYTYRSEYYPSLFDADCKPKPAYYAIQHLLENYTE